MTKQSRNLAFALDPRTKLFLAVVANGMIFSAPLVYSLLMVVVASILLLLEGKWKFVCTFFFVYLTAGFFFDFVKNLDIGTSGTIILASLFFFGMHVANACFEQGDDTLDCDDSIFPDGV